MKKLFTIMLAVMMVVGMTTAAMAAFQVEVKTNSEGITAAAGACEKAGNITFIFDAGTVIQDGDWWTADLPLGVTLCRSIDFVVLGSALGGGIVPGPGGFPVGATAVLADGTTLDNDVWAIKDLAGIALTNANVTVAGSAMFFRVFGSSGSSRLTIEAYDSDDLGVGGIALAANSDGTSTFTVGVDGEFQLKLFDSEPHDGTGPSGLVLAANDTDGDGTYNEALLAGDALQAVNDWDNSYCISVDTTIYTAGTVNVSINSGGITGNNFLTFNPSNPQVAHLISATTIQLGLCKADEYGFVSLAGGQNATCLFNYDDGPLGYCADVGSALFTTSTIGGNRVIVQNTSGTFFNVGDDYRVVLRVSGNGAYFAAGGPANIQGFTPANTTFCDAVPAGATNVATAWTPATETGAAFTTYNTGVGCGAFTAGQEVVALTSTVFTGIDTFNNLSVNIPAIAYDPAVVAAGGQVVVTVELWRLPCGLIFTGDRTVAEFVATCPTAAPATTLYYPYVVALDGSAGWWSGMTIGNPSSAAGTATITVVEADGDIGTYTTPSINALGLWVMGGAGLLAELTADAANTGTLGDSACHIVVVCNFASAGGFAMQGNTQDSTGYTAYGNSATWNY